MSKLNSKILNLKDVTNLTGLSRSTIYALIKKQLFPKQILLGIRRVAWLESDIQAWLDNRIAQSRTPTPSQR